MLLRRALITRLQSLRRLPLGRAFASSQSSVERIRIVEVGPRDGLQNEKNIVPLETKIELIERLSGTGLRDIEAGAFVSPKWVPQMANSSQILEHLLRNRPCSTHPISYSFLVPNIKGLETALGVSASTNIHGRTDLPPTPPSTPPPQEEAAPITSSHGFDEMSTYRPDSTSTDRSAPITSAQDAKKVLSGNPNLASTRPTDPDALQPDEVSVFAAATETFSQKNTNCSIAESLERFKPVISLAKSKNIRVRAYVSVVLGCPYEGYDVSPAKVAELCTSLLAMGADEISLGDTTGMGTAPRVLTLLRTLDDAGVRMQELAVHFHDTYGQALVNSAIALDHGIRTFDASVAGLGGCPYAKGATGNVATEDLVYFVQSLGMETGTDLEKLSDIGAWISQALGRENGSRAGKAILARQ